jgi:hypothetical protein
VWVLGDVPVEVGLVEAVDREEQYVFGGGAAGIAAVAGVTVSGLVVVRRGDRDRGDQQREDRGEPDDQRAGSGPGRFPSLQDISPSGGFRVADETTPRPFSPVRREALPLSYDLVNFDRRPVTKVSDT